MTNRRQKETAPSLVARLVVVAAALAAVHCRSQEKEPEPTLDLATAWAHITDISGYLARTQAALQAGPALVDVAICPVGHPAETE